MAQIRAVRQILIMGRTEYQGSLKEGGGEFVLG